MVFAATGFARLPKWQELSIHGLTPVELRRWIKEYFNAFEPHRTVNRYLYCANNPINFIDPLGLQFATTKAYRMERAESYIEGIDKQIAQKEKEISKIEKIATEKMMVDVFREASAAFSERNCSTDSIATSFARGMEEVIKPLKESLNKMVEENPNILSPEQKKAWDRANRVEEAIDSVTGDFSEKARSKLGEKAAQELQKDHEQLNTDLDTLKKVRDDLIEEGTAGGRPTDADLIGETLEQNKTTPGKNGKIQQENKEADTPKKDTNRNSINNVETNQDR